MEGKEAPIQKTSLRDDAKFRWLLFSILVVGVFEFLSLAGWHLLPSIAAPFFGAVIILIGYRTLWGGLRALAKLNFRSINLLLLIATAGAFYLGEYEEAAVVIVLFTLGERLEQFGIQTSKSALQALVDRTPKMALIKEANGETKELDVSKIAVGDILVIKPSDMIALDAEVVSGSSSVDESTITGEPLPKDKHAGKPVFAGTLNLQGYLEARVLKLASESTLARIIDTTFQATNTKAETQKFIEQFSAYYTPLIIVIAALLVVVPVIFLNQPFNPWLEKALTLLVIACPCALVISTPISIYAAIGNASSRGALVKGGKYIEAIGRVKAIAMDKTRTLTFGRPKVTDVIAFGESTREHLLACAAGIESYSEHPLAQSIVDAARAEKIDLHAAENFQAVMGKGVKADCVVCYDKHHCVGKLPFITEEHRAQDEVIARVDELQREGKTSIVVSNSEGIEGVIAVTDELKPESKDSVAQLSQLGITTVMVTGDNRAPAEAVASIVGISEVRAEMLPEHKADEIKKLTSTYGAVAMVGDGVNDAPALALSSVGIAMGAAGSDTAIESASIALLNDRIELVPYLVRLGRRTISTIKINTALAIGTKLVFIALAIAGLSSLALAIFADVGVTVVVILNSLRILRFERVHGSSLRCFFLVAALMIPVTISLAQTGPQRNASATTPREQTPRSASGTPLVTNTDLVTLLVTVTDREGTHISGLNKRAFTVYDDRRPQEITFFNDADTPISLAVIFDTSGSMSGDKILRARDALGRFVETSHRPDEYFLISFSDRARLLLDKSRDAEAMLAKLAEVKPRGETTLYDATYLGLEKVSQGSQPKRTILLITDGNDTSSRYPFKELRRALQETDVVVYAIGILGFNRSEARQGRSTLSELTKVTGGKAFFPDSSAKMMQAFEQIALELRAQYSIGYRPSDLTDKRSWHRVKVDLAAPEKSRMRVRTREGFFAP